MRSDQINEIAAALAKAQGHMENAIFNRVNPHFRSKYADLASVFNAIRKALSENGIAVSQPINNNELETLLLHTSGQWLSSSMTLPTTAKPQELGSWLTYYRRYALTSLAGVSADDDDDGNIAMKTNGKIETSSPVSIEQLGHIQRALVENGIDIAWLIEFANKRNIPIARLEEIPASMCEKFLTAIASKAKQDERSRASTGQ